jgi:hypothetical protein
MIAVIEVVDVLGKRACEFRSVPSTTSLLKRSTSLKSKLKSNIQLSFSNKKMGVLDEKVY